MRAACVVRRLGFLLFRCRLLLLLLFSSFCFWVRVIFWWIKWNCIREMNTNKFESCWNRTQMNLWTFFFCSPTWSADYSQTTIMLCWPGFLVQLLCCIVYSCMFWMCTVFIACILCMLLFNFECESNTVVVLNLVLLCFLYLTVAFFFVESMNKCV